MPVVLAGCSRHPSWACQQREVEPRVMTRSVGLQQSAPPLTWAASSQIATASARG